MMIGMERTLKSMNAFFTNKYCQYTAKGDVELKEWECVQVDHHRNVGKTIDEWQKKGWRLHTYQADTYYHYLLFEKGE
jgi:hypothetical protein